MSAQPEMTNSHVEPADFAPTVICDVGLGEFVNNLDVDAEFFGAIIASRIGQTAIDRELTLHISADCSVEGPRRKRIVNIGNYDKHTNTMKVNMGSIKYILDYGLAYPKAGVDYSPKALNERGSSRASGNAVHESRHHIDELTMDPDELWEELIGYLDGIIPESIFNQALRESNVPRFVQIAELKRQLKLSEAANEMGHADYVGSPAEQRARELQKSTVAACKKRGDYPISVRFKWDQLENNDDSSLSKRDRLTRGLHRLFGRPPIAR